MHIHVYVINSALYGNKKLTDMYNRHKTLYRSLEKERRACMACPVREIM